MPLKDCRLRKQEGFQQVTAKIAAYLKACAAGVSLSEGGDSAIIAATYVSLMKTTIQPSGDAAADPQAEALRLAGFDLRPQLAY